MTLRVIDVAPNEAPLAALADRLERASSGGEPLTEEEIRTFLETEPAFLETAKSMLREYFAKLPTADVCPIGPQPSPSERKS